MMSGFSTSTPTSASNLKNGESSIDARKRNRFTNEQIQALELLFLDCPRPCKETQMQASKDLGLALRTVIIWFQNRRAKAKHSGEHIPENVLQWKPPMVAEKTVDSRKSSITQLTQKQAKFEHKPTSTSSLNNVDNSTNITEEILEAEKWIESFSRPNHLEAVRPTNGESQQQMQFNSLAYNSSMQSQPIYPTQSNSMGQNLSQSMLNDNFNFETQSITSLNSNLSNFNPMMYQSSANQSNLSLSTMASSHWSNESYIQNGTDLGQFYQMQNSQNISNGMLNQMPNMSGNFNQQINPNYPAQSNNAPGKMQNLQKSFNRSLNRSGFFNFRS